MAKCIFVLLIGNKERGDINHFQLLEEETARNESRRLGFHVEVFFAPAMDQLRALRSRLLDTSAPALDAVVTEPANTTTMEMALRELKGKTSLFIMHAWALSIEQAATDWGAGLALGSVSTNHALVGEIQARQVNVLLPSGGRILYVSGPASTSAAQQRLQGLKAGLGPAIEMAEIVAGRWTEPDGIAAFSDWYRVAKHANPVVQAVVGGNDELALGVRHACQALANSQHREALLRAKFLGVDGCPGYGQKLVADGTLTASVVTPANTALALAHLDRFWRNGTPVPLRSFAEASAWPPTSVAS
jgi:ABC-type sugar transport system substrate-binding protein